MSFYVASNVPCEDSRWSIFYRKRARKVKHSSLLFNYMLFKKRKNDLTSSLDLLFITFSVFLWRWIILTMTSLSSFPWNETQTNCKILLWLLPFFLLVLKQRIKTEMQDEKLQRRKSRVRAIFIILFLRIRISSRSLWGCISYIFLILVFSNQDPLLSSYFLVSCGEDRMREEASCSFHLSSRISY